MGIMANSNVNIVYEPYLQPEPLTNLKFYKLIILSLASLLVHWWNLAATAFPMWMAPNLITLCGFAFIIINIACLAVYVPDMIGPGPSWVYMSFAIGLFLYQTFDNVDGRQARRTGTSSALGHIFDHTIDSLNCALGGVLQAASLSLGHTPKAVFVVLVGCAAMWFSTWEEYYTGTLYLGYFNGPTEGLLIACIVHVISGFYGPEIWLKPLNSLPFLEVIPCAFLLQDIVVYLALFSLIFVHIPACLLNVRTHQRSKDLPFARTLTNHIPFLVFNLAATAWILSPRSSLLRTESEGLIEFAVLITFAFGKLGPRVILARLTRSPFPWFNFGAFIPLVAGAVYVNVPYLAPKVSTGDKTEWALLYAGIVVSTSSFLHWAYLLCRGFMHTLDIGCFKIKHRKTGNAPEKPKIN